MHVADSLCCTTESNSTVKQLYSNKVVSKKKKEPCQEEVFTDGEYRRHRTKCSFLHSPDSSSAHSARGWAAYIWLTNMNSNNNYRCLCSQSACHLLDRHSLKHLTCLLLPPTLWGRFCNPLVGFGHSGIWSIERLIICSDSRS